MRAICRTDTAPTENAALSRSSNGDKQHGEMACCSQALLRVLTFGHNRLSGYRWKVPFQTTQSGLVQM
jgi:hypothetical protein